MNKKMWLAGGLVAAGLLLGTGVAVSQDSEKDPAVEACAEAEGFEVLIDPETGEPTYAVQVPDDATQDQVMSEKRRALADCEEINREVSAGNNSAKVSERPFPRTVEEAAAEAESRMTPEARQAWAEVYRVADSANVLI